jgi:two-component system, CitB family, sensor kinase
VLAALLMGKAAAASERGVELRISEDTFVPADVFDPRDLVKIVGNLVDNAIDAVSGAPPPHRVTVHAEVASRNGRHLTVRVADTGPGLDPSLVDRAFQRGWSTKLDDGPHARGLGMPWWFKRYTGTEAVSAW